MGRLLALILILLLNSIKVNANPTQQALLEHEAIKARLLTIRNLASDELKEYIDLELKYLPIPVDIRHFHPKNNNKTRAFVVAWLGELAEVYGLSYHSYFLSISILDRFIHMNALRKNPVQLALSKIQLAGISALKIATNVNEETEKYAYEKKQPQLTPPFSPDKDLNAKPRYREESTFISLFSNKHCNDLCNKAYTPGHVDRMTRAI